MEICQLLVDMRKQSGKTQQQLALYIEVDVRTYQNYEYGIYEISAKDLFRLIQYCRYYTIVKQLDRFIHYFWS